MLHANDDQQPLMIVGIAGASGAGKSRLAELLYQRLSAEQKPGDIGILNEDAYYRDRSELTFADREKINYDHPDSLEHSLLLEHLDQLRQGKAVDVPIYEYEKHNRSSESIRLEPPRILILEGILILSDPDICRALDLRVFVDVPLDICLTRRLRRDMEERGRSLDSVLTQYHNSVRPMFFKFIKPSKQHADLIVPRGGENQHALNVLLTHLEFVLSTGKTS